MLKPEIIRVTREIMRLSEGLARLRLLEGVTEFKSLDDAGKISEANNALRDQAETVIFTKNRIANAINKEPAIITCMETFYGYTLAELKADFLPLVNIANQILNNYPNITRAQVDAVSISEPEMLTDATTEDL